MQITEQTTQIFTIGARNARSLVRTITPEGMTLEPEMTEEELRLQSSTISFQRQLTQEEENRVLFLQNLLAQTLAMADGQPTEEQRSRIREIEKELEKITGVKVRSSLSSATKNLPKNKDEDDEQTDRDLDGIDPDVAKHSRRAESDDTSNPGMQLLQQNTTLLEIDSLLTSSGTQPSLS